MANIKTGLIYYNVDTDRYQDVRIRRLKNAFGCSGIAVYDYILCEIYRVKGCFLEWGESRAFDVADYFGLKENLVIEIVNYCGVVGLFDKALLTGGSISKSTQAMSRCGEVGDGSSVPACGGIITSKSIQSRYIDMCTRAKRKDIKIPEECHIIPEESTKIPEESTKPPEVCRKEENSKEKKSNPPTPLGEEDFSDFKKIIEKVTISDDAKQARGLIASALSGSGFDCSKEFRVENRGDGKRGKIDIYASKGGVNYAIEINGDTLRQKSVFKLGQVDSAFKIILLRSGKAFCVQGIDWVYSFGIEKGSTGFDYSFIRENLKVPFNDWLDYKRSRGQMYNMQRTLQECYSHLEDLSHGDTETAKLIVKRSMANNWAGIFELKASKANKKNEISKEDFIKKLR
jgi:hypothetical protein